MHIGMCHQATCTALHLLFLSLDQCNFSATHFMEHLGLQRLYVWHGALALSNPWPGSREEGAYDDCGGREQQKPEQGLQLLYVPFAMG